ncbi:MAG: hypothetical protein GX091_06150 [Peptococcaceae bacterium]|mgnify:FL=1|nr:hypothetical protein [Peptococcaceae bacterium]
MEKTPLISIDVAVRIELAIIIALLAFPIFKEPVKKFFKERGKKNGGKGPNKPAPSAW